MEVLDKQAFLKTLKIGYLKNWSYLLRFVPRFTRSSDSKVNFCVERNGAKMERI